MSPTYNAAYRPAFPALTVRLQAEAAPSGSVPALIDTGADITFVPTDLLEQIGAVESEPVRVRSHFGDSHTVQLYLVGMEIEGLALPGLYVVGDDTGSEIILGRDVLNKLAIFLDGPGQQSEILDEASANRLRGRH